MEGSRGRDGDGDEARGSGTGTAGLWVPRRRWRWGTKLPLPGAAQLHRDQHGGGERSPNPWGGSVGCAGCLQTWGRAAGWVQQPPLASGTPARWER